MRLRHAAAVGTTLLLVAITFCAIAAATADDAQWPARPVRVIAPYAPGGLTDTMARISADKLGRYLGQTFFVENRPGAGGSIGTEYAARQRADGYSLYFASGAQFNVLPLIEKIKYDPGRDFSPVSILGYNGNVCAIDARLPAKTIPEFVAYAKAHPGQISYGMSGVGTISQLVPALLMARAKIQMVQVPYEGAALALTDLLAGHIQMTCSTASDYLGYGEGSPIRLLGITTQTRLKNRPDLPTFAETFPGFVFLTWDGYFVQTGTPQYVTERLLDGIRHIAKDPDLLKKFSALGIETVAYGPKGTTDLLHKEAPLFAEAVRAAGLSH
jgi:tripartite-type tricarboxylate transporter receptor subunit TctC